MKNSGALAAALALAVCAAAPSAISAQEPAGQAQATTQSPLDGLRRARDGFIGARDFSAALGPAENVVDAQRTQREPPYAADLAALWRYAPA